MRGTPRRPGRRRSSCRRGARSTRACPTVGVDEPRGVRPVVVGVRAPGRERPEQQHDQHDGAHDAQRAQGGREERREERRPVGVGPVEADQTGRDRLHRAAGREVRAHAPAFGPQRDRAEHDHGDQVGRDEAHQAQQRRRVRRRPEVVAEPHERHQHDDAEGQRHRVRPLEHVGDDPDRVEDGRDPPGGPFASESWSASTSSSRPTTTETTCPATGSQSGSRSTPCRSIRECTTGRTASSCSRPVTAVSAARTCVATRRRSCSAGGGIAWADGAASGSATTDRKPSAIGGRGRVGASSGRGAPPGPPPGGVNSGRRVGKRMTSRMESTLARSITSRSMPMPRPPVQGMPCSSART